MAIWYVRDNSTDFSGDTTKITVGSIGWSAVTAWSASASIAPGTLRRQTAANAVFTASQSTTVVTVSAVTSGKIYIGMTLKPASGLSVSITSLGTGTGGTGTYNVSNSQTVASGTWNGGMFATSVRVFVAAQSSTGTTGSTEPNWSTSKGGSTTDNTVTWIECTGQPAVNGDLTNTPASSTVRSSSPGRGKIIKDNSATHIFIQSSASGTAGSGEPTYVTTSVGSTTSDGTVTWTYIGASFSNWAAPHALLDNAETSTWGAAGDTFYLGDDHSEIQAIANSLSITPGTPGSTASPCFVYSIDHTLSLPVSSSGLKSGATIASFSGVQINGYAYWNGITITSGTGNGGTVPLIITGGKSKYENCLLNLVSTASTNNRIEISENIDLINTTMSFGNAGQWIQIIGGSGPATLVTWRNTPSAISGTVPTTLFGSSSTNSQLTGFLVLEGVDLSAVGSGKTLVSAGTTGSGTNTGKVTFIDCKLGSSVTFAATPADRSGPLVDFVRCSSSSATYIQRRYWYEGTLQEEATIIRTGGASDGTTGISWNIATTANALWVDPFESFPVAIWNGVTASNRTVTLHGIWNSASLPNNDDVWIDVAYLGASGSPLASFGTETKSNNLASGSALTADSTSAWDSLVSARQNSHAYSLGDVIKTSSNAGRIFFCTTAGTTAGSEPGGYAGAADGGSVTDSGAVFRAGTRFLLTVTLSTPQPQLVGYLRAYVKAAKVSSTFYVDPLIVLS